MTDERKLTESRQKAHIITLSPGVRMSDVEVALGRAGFALQRDKATGAAVIRDIPPLIANRFGRRR